MELALTDNTAAGPILTEFWVRSLGFSGEFSHIKTLLQLPAAERLLAALLRSDRAAFIQILDQEHRSPTLLEQLVARVRVESLGCFVYERIIALDLAGELQICIDESTPSPFAAIRMLSMTGVANHYQLDEKFARVLKLTKEHRSKTLWVKGAHLSRSVYKPSYFRHFGDLDVIVHPAVIEGFVDDLKKAEFHSIHSPAYCNQIGVGPLNRTLDLIMAPSNGWIPSGALTMGRKSDGNYVDIKVGPFERGLQVVQFERLFADAVESSCLGNDYLAPSLPDHLLIMLCNYAKNRFKTWRTLLDIHLLVTALNETPVMWQRFVEICKTEAISTTAWVCLSMSVDRLSTPVPNSVLAALAPDDKLLSSLLSFTLEPAYVWNSTSLPMMLLNAFASADRKRKLDLLANSFFPSARFLCDYYGKREDDTHVAYLRYLLKHWFVLLMPGGLVRRTFGKIWWSSEPQF